MGRGKMRVVVLVAGSIAISFFILFLTSPLSPPPPPTSFSFLRVPLQVLQDQNQTPVKPSDDAAPVIQPKVNDCIHGSSGGGTVGGGRWIEGLPPLYIVTPTYPRAEQIPEITRTAQTLMNVANVVWIVSEDAATPTPALTAYLKDSTLNSVYLRTQMPSKYMKEKNKPRGVANRMAGLNWVRKNAKTGVLYFADDDNTYDIRIFDQMRWTKKISMFPVGLVTKLGVSTPIVRDGRVKGFYDGWIANRKFPVDMAGFAVSVPFLLTKPNASMPFTVGYEEDGFIKSLGITSADIEPLAYNCTKIWVWHTQTKKNGAASPVAQNDITIGSNLDVIKEMLWKDPAKPATKSTYKKSTTSGKRKKS